MPAAGSVDRSDSKTGRKTHLLCEIDGELEDGGQVERLERVGRHVFGKEVWGE